MNVHAAALAKADRFDEQNSAFAQDKKVHRQKTMFYRFSVRAVCTPLAGQGHLVGIQVVLSGS